MMMAQTKYYTVGIDSGTQSTKALLLDVRTGEEIAVAQASYSLIEKPDGTREQDPAIWIDAVKKTICEVLRTSGVEGNNVIAIGVSGQQHGFVPLDADGNVLRAAKLWNDTSTQSQCETLLSRLGGVSGALKEIGNTIPPGFTASKILWLKEKEPALYDRMAHVLLPHDYINYWLTGEAVMEPGDASGTALFDVRRRVWSDAAVNAIDSSGALRACLPPVRESHTIVGTLRPSVAKELGLSPSCYVSAGGGDNMMSAIGTGNVEPGVVTASLGTSGTLFAYSDVPVVDEERGEMAAFCSSTGGWLPLLCVMNCTVSTEVAKGLFDITTEALTDAATAAPVGSDGVILVPYFSGERTPNVPHGRGVYYGLTTGNTTKENLCRAAMEGAVMSMRYGLDRLRAQGIEPTNIRLTGGGAKSALWRQICADIFNVECVTMLSDEAAALGGAIQAVWAYECEKTGMIPIKTLTQRYVKCGRAHHTPDADAVGAYANVYTTYRSVSERLYPPT